MGQSTSNSQIITSDNQSHQRLGVIKVFQVSDMFNQQQQSNYQIEIKKNLQSQEKFQKWLKKMRQIDTEQARDVLYLPLSFKFQKTAICGSSGQLILTFEYFPYVLKTQIRNRRKMSQYFQQSQLWYLLYNLVEAGTIFQRKGYKIGDVHPNNCLLNENGQFKVIAGCSLPDQTTNYDKIVESPTNDAFLAPQQIDPTFLQKGIYPHVDQCRAQIYSIGMTLLEAATLQDCFYTYSRGPYKINKKKLGDLLKIVKQKYSKLFYDYLSKMLDEQSKRRKICSQVFAELYPYEDAILQLREWNMSDNPNENSTDQLKEKTQIMQNKSNNNQRYNNSAQNVINTRPISSTNDQPLSNYQKTTAPQQHQYQQSTYYPQQKQQMSYNISTNQFINNNTAMSNTNNMSANTMMMRQQPQYPQNIINTNQTINYHQPPQSQMMTPQKTINGQTFSMTSIDNTVTKRS